MRLALATVVIATIAAAGVDTAPTPGAMANWSETVVAHDPGQPGRALPGFSDTLEHTFGEDDHPTAIAWLPDQRMLATTKEGRLWIFPRIQQGYGQPNVVLDLSARICADIERGLVGLAVDPDFANNGFVYLYWTHDAHDDCANEGLADAPENRVTRHELASDGSEVESSRTVIVDHIDSPRAHHIAGDLEFASDGFLYISVGDGVCRIPDVDVCGGQNNNSQLRRLPHGKILRVTRGGLPPPGNPYVGDDGARRCTRPSGAAPGRGPCLEIFASGLRNPYRIARRPGTSTFFVNDVGNHLWEEIDRLAKGANYGWNIREGHCVRDSTTNCGPTSFDNPIFDYPHDDCRSVTGGAFVPPGLWPPRFDGAYLFSDFTCDTIFRLVRTETGLERRTFLSGMRQPVHLRFGPSPLGRSLYYLSFFRREIHRVAYSEDNVAPVGDFSFRPDGLVVAFNGSKSYDPDQDGITEWHWDFDDGADSSTSAPTTSHTFGAAGTYDVTLTVTDSEGAVSPPVARQVTVPEHPPTLEVDWPSDSETFAVGEQVPISATATDQEDGALSGASIRWEFRLHHGNHVHPHAVRHGNNITVPYPAPEDLTAAAESDLLAIVTATDSSGLTSRAVHTLVPSTVELTFVTRPAGGRVYVEGDVRNTRISVSSWEGHTFRVRAPDQAFGGQQYVFRSWSDGGTRIHDITTPSAPTTYTARFGPAG